MLRPRLRRYDSHYVACLALNATGTAPSPLVSEENSLPSEVGAEIANAIVSKVVEAIVLVQHGDPGLATALGGGAGGATKSLLSGAQRMWARRRRRVGLALDAAREHTGRDPMELLELAIDRESDQAFELFVRALQAAARDADDDRSGSMGALRPVAYWPRTMPSSTRPSESSVPSPVSTRST
jgi:hypothetical protein